MPPRFTICRKTGAVTVNKPLTGEEICKLQKAILIEYTNQHPEIFREDGTTAKREEALP